MLFQIEYENEAHDMSFESIESVQSNPVSEMSVMSENILGSESEKSEMFEVFEENESKTYTEFPNDAYKDLMLLVTKYKINNKAGNEIIRFFNKHSNLAKSPLPKNIEKGRAFMNNMKFSNLEFNKVLITCHNGKDYFLYYQDLIHSIKNILAVPNITQNFALSYENNRVNIITFKSFNNILFIT